MAILENGDQRRRELFNEAKRYLAGGVSSQFRAGSAMLFERAEGPYLWDVDGARYIDFALGQGPTLLGHAHPAVVERATEAARKGVLYAGGHELEIALAEHVCRLIPCAERVRFGSTGSEVVQAALRLSRAVTGRQKYIKFEGHYHGWFDNVAISVKPTIEEAGPRHAPNAVPWSGGMARSALDDVIVLPWNDADLLRRTLESSSQDVAAVIMEPMMCNNGCVVPRSGFLRAARQLCDEHGVVLIFDEIITGFRLGLGGAQEYLDVVPDLATFAKAMGTGFPISMLAGKELLMRHIASGEVLQAGTYNTNTITTAASLATVEELEMLGADGYRSLRELGLRLAEGLRQAARKTGWRVLVQGPGPMFHMGFTERERVEDYRDTLGYDEDLYSRFVNGMKRRGVRLIGRGIWYISFAHTGEHIETALQAAEDSLSAMASGTE